MRKFTKFPCKARLVNLRIDGRPCSLDGQEVTLRGYVFHNHIEQLEFDPIPIPEFPVYYCAYAPEENLEPILPTGEERDREAVAKIKRDIFVAPAAPKEVA